MFSSFFRNERVFRVDFTGKSQKQGGKPIFQWPGVFLLVFPKYVGSFYPRAPNQLVKQTSGLEGHGYPGYTLKMGKGSLDDPHSSHLATRHLIIIWWVDELCIIQTLSIALGIPM